MITSDFNFESKILINKKKKKRQNLLLKAEHSVKTSDVPRLKGKKKKKKVSRRLVKKKV